MVVKEHLGVLERGGGLLHKQLHPSTRGIVNDCDKVVKRIKTVGSKADKEQS